MKSSGTPTPAEQAALRKLLAGARAGGARWLHQAILQVGYLDQIAVQGKQLASLFGVSAQAVGLWAKRDGCPRNADGTYDLGEVIRWRERSRTETETDEGLPKGYKNWPEFWTSEKRRLEVEAAKGRLLDAEEVRQRDEMKLISLTRGLENLEELAPHLEGLDARRIRKTIRDRVRDLREAYARER